MPAQEREKGTLSQPRIRRQHLLGEFEVIQGGEEKSLARKWLCARPTFASTLSIHGVAN
jgi:hypothetical protein